MELRTVLRTKDESEGRKEVKDVSWTKVGPKYGVRIFCILGPSLSLGSFLPLSSLYDATQASPPLLIRLVYIVSNHIGTFCKKYEEGREEVNVV